MIAAAVEKSFPADKIQDRSQRGERDQSKQVGGEQWVVRFGPFLESRDRIAEEFGRERDQNAGKRAARDVTGSEQNAGALVRFGDHLFFGQVLLPQPLKEHFVDEEPYHAADEDRG